MDNFSATAARMLPGVGSPVSVGGGMFDITAIPGFYLVQRLFLKLGLDSSLLVTIGMSLTLLTSLFSFFTYSISSVTTLTRFISANLVSSATVHSSDVTYLYVMRWLAANHVSTDCRLFCVTSRKNPMSHAVKRFSSYGPYGDASARNEDDDDDDLDGLDESCEEDRLGPKLKYTPAPGFLYFWYKKNLILINRKLDLTYYTGDIPDETMILTTIGRSPICCAKKTTVYTISPTPFAQKSWDQGRHRPSRDISTVILPPESKKLLLGDVKEYLNPITARWYAQRGLPYRRGYLFYGPPGTGKTSLSLALAGELKVPLYILSLSTGSLTDETLTMLFVGLPKKCIVLLEDIDCAGVQRNNNGNFMFDDSDSEDPGEEDDSSDSDSKSGTSKIKEIKSKKKTTNKMEATTGPHNRMKASVSFSGLLNAIDGVASHEGRILIMTTNHRERLDPALIRPGRVDMQVEFGYAGRDTLEEIFRELYSQVDGMDSAMIEEEEEVFGREDEPLIPSEKKARNEIDRQAQYTHLIAELAEKFARMIPADKFTPAEVQGFLISYKRAPRLAIRNLPAWLDSKRSANEKKGRRKTKKAKPEETPDFKKPGPSKNTLSINTGDLHDENSEILKKMVMEILSVFLNENGDKINKAPPTPIPSPTSPTPVKNEVTTTEQAVSSDYNEGL